jgi:hypothetical protein
MKSIVGFIMLLSGRIVLLNYHSSGGVGALIMALMWILCLMGFNLILSGLTE